MAQRLACWWLALYRRTFLLPATSDKGFSLTIRMYAPKAEAVQGKWLPPLLPKTIARMRLWAFQFARGQ